jgi:hypothetical protein
MSKPIPLSIAPRPKVRTRTSAEILAAPPPGVEQFHIPSEGVLRITETANDAPTDMVVLSGKADLMVHQLIAKFGFERMPQTMGELEGLITHCRSLFFAPGDDMPECCRPAFVKAGLDTWEKYAPEFREAAVLYLAGDLEGLRKHHIENKVLERRGRVPVDSSRY